MNTFQIPFDWASTHYNGFIQEHLHILFDWANTEMDSFVNTLIYF